MLDAIPIGALVPALCTALAVAPVRRHRQLGAVSSVLGTVPNVLPGLFLLAVLLSAAPSAVTGAFVPARDGLEAGLTVVTVAGVVVLGSRQLQAGRVLERALDGVLGPGWRGSGGRGLRRRPRLIRFLRSPWPARPRDVERVSDVRYGEDNRYQRLDVYRHRSRPEGAPTFIHLHGGGFRRGRTSWEARPVLHHLASRGWTCLSAGYRLSPTPADGFPGHLVDVKRVIAWARSEGHGHGIDPATIVLAGSSAGAHLAAMAALTANDPAFQTGFEASDTSVTAAVGFSGYYGRLGGADDVGTSPLDRLTAGAPPFLLVHGSNDTWTPVEGARALADGLRRTSANPVVLAELPGAQHDFDVVRSVRLDAVVAATEAFADWARHPSTNGSDER